MALPDEKAKLITCMYKFKGDYFFYKKQILFVLLIESEATQFEFFFFEKKKPQNLSGHAGRIKLVAHLEPTCMAQPTESYKRARSKAHLDTSSRVATHDRPPRLFPRRVLLRRWPLLAAVLPAAGGPIHRCVREMTVCVAAPATEATLPRRFPRGRKAGVRICPHRCCRPLDPSGFVA